MATNGKAVGPMQRILQFSLVLTALYIAATLYFGLRAHSLALVSEAGHNVSDLAGEPAFERQKAGLFCAGLGHTGRDSVSEANCGHCGWRRVGGLCGSSRFSG